MGGIYTMNNCCKARSHKIDREILTVKDIYINSNLNPLTKFTSSSRGIAFKDALPWNISQIITKTVLISTRIVISCKMKQHPIVNLMESQWKLR